MKRILITADTHGRIDEVVRLMENVEFDAVIHLGDYTRDALSIKKLYPDKEFYIVKGNNDFSGETERVITVGKHKIFLCHGHLHGVEMNLLRLSLEARERGADVALFGHIHTPEDIMVNSVRIFSPGSPSYPRMSSRSLGILEEENGAIEMAHYCLD